jgi:hypothetical protein
MTSLQEEQTAPPKLYEHCLTVFEQMRTEAKPTAVEGTHALVYEGFLTRLFNKLSLATPYYTSVMQALRKMGCVKQLSRGGGASPSKWELLQEPTLELFNSSTAKRLHDNTKMGQLQQQVSDLRDRLDDVEEMVAAMTEVKEAS